MERLLSTFQKHQKQLFLVGTAARNFLRFGNWGEPGVVEFIALVPRHKLIEMEGLSLPETIPARGPVPVEVQLDSQTAIGYITCVNPRNKNPKDALKRALERRGFRVDALAIDAMGQVIDPFGAQKELEQRTITLFHKEPVKAFEEDALRLIRASRLVAEFKGTIAAPLRKAIHREAGRVLYAPRDGWFREMTMLLCAEHVWEGMQSLFDSRVLGLLLPEVHDMVGFAETSKYHHKDLWDHTRQVVDQAKPIPLVRWAALLHDVGKIWTRTYGNGREVHFFQHDELGAILVEGIGTRFRMDPTFQEELAFLVRYHLRPNSYESSWTDSAVRRLMRESGDLIQPLLLLSQADMTSGREHKRREAARLSKELAARIEEIREKDAKRSPLPKGIGVPIIELFEIPPGPRIGRIKKFLEQHVEEGSLQGDQPIQYYVDFLKELPQLPE